MILGVSESKMGEVEEEEGQEASTDPSLPIQKKVLHAGRGEVPDYKDGTKVNHCTLFRPNIFVAFRSDF